MSYLWPLDVRELFEERYPQMINTGLPVPDVDAVRAAITDMWTDAPGGWAREWSKLAESYAAAGEHRQAALAYGWAKFPAVVGEPGRAALANQLAQYRLAAPEFGVDFRREILNLPYRDGTTAVPVHVLAPFDLPEDAPVVIASGGVDTWKMDVHDILVTLAEQLRVRVLAFDIPGTGESKVPMSAIGGAQIISGLIAHARTLGNGVVAHLGISMGGHFAARAGLTGEVDAAVVLGGPVEEAFTRGVPSRFGMSGIIGNALGFDRTPTDDELAERFSSFSLRPMLDQDRNAPMLVVNGADDVHVPKHDTLVFEGRRNTVADLIPGTGHCAISELPQVVPVILAWLAQTLASTDGL
ncbi:MULTISPECIES: alpha/beta fold hydrolase [unclassified Nocardia]|uniref:alpha/beta fold hydrolase n=1 Tax=unclassified Nocardia TaxID=2637762 RepID=UPI001CE4A86B|nr:MULTISPECIES: alpha/beta fold hydrolase [unclassified Nocardia]